MRHGDKRRSIPLASVVLGCGLLAATPALAAKIPVTTCGQFYEGVGVLTGNLDCTGSGAPGVHLGHSSTLDLAGFTLSGGDGDGVLCDDRCAVISTDPGAEISGFAGYGVLAVPGPEDAAFIRVNRVAIRDNGLDGVRLEAEDGGVQVSKGEVSGNGGAGIVSPGRVRIGNQLVTGNALEGIRGASVSVGGSVISFNGTGVQSSGYMRVSTSEVVDNIGDGIHAGPTLLTFRVHVERNGGTGIVIDSVEGDTRIFLSEVSYNGLDGIRVDGQQLARVHTRLAFVRYNGRHGIAARRLEVSRTRVDFNAFHGIYAPPGDGDCVLSVQHYSMIGNGTDASCGVSVTCADIATCTLPANLNGTPCDTSYDTNSGFPGVSWGICDDD